MRTSNLKILWPLGERGSPRALHEPFRTFESCAEPPSSQSMENLAPVQQRGRRKAGDGLQECESPSTAG